MKLPTYSIAIRTLGTSGDKFVQELKSIQALTIQPEKIVIYLAEGYSKPEFSIGREEYVYVKKGMVAQRALPYDEIDSDFILLLDDDIRLAPDSVEILLKAVVENNADCVGADTFRNQDMSLKGKLYAILTNLVFPRPNDQWAFKVNRNGSFSYNNKPEPKFYLSQSCAGPASLWKKSSLLAIHLEQELWLDKLGFAFGDDVVEFYKLHSNGYKLGVHYGVDIEHLDAKSMSSVFQKSDKKFYTRSKASFIIWWRTCYNLTNKTSIDKIYTLLTFIFKAIWLLIINIISGIVMRKMRIPVYYVKGLIDGSKFVSSRDYKKIENFIISK